MLSHTNKAYPIDTLPKDPIIACMFFIDQRYYAIVHSILTALADKEIYTFIGVTLCFVGITRNGSWDAEKSSSSDPQGKRITQELLGHTSAPNSCVMAVSPHVSILSPMLTVQLQIFYLPSISSFLPSSFPSI